MRLNGEIGGGKALGLNVPDVYGLSSEDAALAYAEAGWYLLPTDPADIKNPGSVVGGKWQQRSSRELDQIRRWWSINPNYGIALHCGRSGAVVFDLDVDTLDAIARDGRPEIAEGLRSAGAIQGTRRHGDRGHFVFDAGGGDFGNGAGAFMRWGQVRGRNGVIIVAPTPHPDTESGGYDWKRHGALTALPDVLQLCLREAVVQADPLNDGELEAFLDTHTGGGCGRDGCRNSPKGPVTQFKAEVADGASRHDTMAKVLPWAMSEAMLGCYSAREAFGQLHTAFVGTFTDRDEPVRCDSLGGEYLRLVKWAAAQADPDRAHRNDQLPTATALEEFWLARPELQRLRTFARARCVGPWSTLGAVLARVIATIPPNVVLPPTIGSEASLNLFVALVARSGFGKNTSEAVAADFLHSATPVFVATPGSGEGILKQYAYKKKAEQINLRNSVMFSVAEIDTFDALTSRSGSTLMPELRKAWMGERLGFGWANVEKAVLVTGHRYRMTMIVGVQPGRAKALLRDADGGTPQRFIWLPTTDPNAPDVPPDEPLPLDLPAWPSGIEGSFAPANIHDTTLKSTPEINQLNLEVEADRSDFHVLELPPIVVETIRREHRAKLRGEVPETHALDAHATLARLKVAVGLMCMNGRTDKVSEEDWDLAGVVMGVSNATRIQVQAALKSKAVAESRNYGRTLGEREIAKDDVVRETKTARVVEGIRQKLRAQNHQTVNMLKHRFSSGDRSYVGSALELLQRAGDVELETIEYQGQPGRIVHLKAGR